MSRRRFIEEIARRSNEFSGGRSLFLGWDRDSSDFWLSLRVRGGLRVWICSWIFEVDANQFPIGKGAETSPVCRGGRLRDEQVVDEWKGGGGLLVEGRSLPDHLVLFAGEGRKTRGPLMWHGLLHADF